MTKVIFSFDTEDYINEEAAEGILRTAKLLRSEGIRGCFQTVTMLAEALVRWNRDDIIEELSKYHEIGYHSRRHSHHPTINEYTDRADYEGARRDFFYDEAIGYKRLKDIFGIDGVTTATPPGNSNSYVARYAYSDMGIPLYTGEQMITDEKNYRPVYNCNTLSIRYSPCLDNVLFDADEDNIKELIDQMRGKDTVVIWHHPQRAYTREFCDIDNFLGKNTPESEWVMSETHTKEETDTFYENFKTLIRLIKNDPEFKIMTHGELYDSMKEAERSITKETLLEIAPQLSESFFPVTVPDSYCISDIFYACKNLLLGKKKHVCGKVYGFLAAPYYAKEPTTITDKELIIAAKSISDEGFLPEYLWADDKKIGPADFIRASIAILSGEKSYTVSPSEPWQIDLDQFPKLRDLSYKNSWIHTKYLEDNFLSERLRLQSWTLRLPKGSDRKIFN